MALDININELIQEKTDQYIGNADYEALRASCLDSTISPVFEEINIKLNIALAYEKEQSAIVHTNRMCDNQIRWDTNEAQRDTDAAHTDLLTIQGLHEEHSSLIAKIPAYKTSIQSQTRVIARQRKDLTDLEERIQLHNQAHATSAHEHGHESTTTQHDHAHTTTQHGHAHAHATTQHGHDETNYLQKELREERSKLIEEQATLSNFQSKYDTMLARQSTIEKELEALNIREQARAKRDELRTSRDHARSRQHEVKFQLSSSNHQTLISDIADSHRQLDIKKTTLMQEASSTGYAIYMSHLNAYLQSPQKLNSQETEALKLIIRYMNEYCNAKKSETSERYNLSVAKGEKNQLEENLKKKQEETTRLKQSNPTLTIENETLNKKNTQLDLDIKTRQEFKSKSLKRSGISFVASVLVAIGGALALAFAPVAISLIALFLPAGLGGLITTGFLIATLAYTKQHSSAKHQLKTNKATIARNETQIASQSETIHTLETTTIPAIQDSIKQSALPVSQIETKVAQLVEKGNIAKASAQRVGLSSVNAANSSSFFETTDAPPAYVAVLSPPLPSAPEEEEASSIPASPTTPTM